MTSKTLAFKPLGIAENLQNSLINQTFVRPFLPLQTFRRKLQWVSPPLYLLSITDERQQPAPRVEMEMSDCENSSRPQTLFSIDRTEWDLILDFDVLCCTQGCSRFQFSDLKGPHRNRCRHRHTGAAPRDSAVAINCST